MTIDIRALQEADLSLLLDLYRHLHEVDDPPPAWETVTAVWQTIQNSSHFLYFGGFVAEQLVTSCTLALIPNLTRGCRPYGVIENVVTHSAFRGRGYGNAVLQHACHVAWGQDCYKVMLMTGRLNEQTFRFYEAAGFDRHAKQAFVAKPPCSDDNRLT